MYNNVISYERKIHSWLYGSTCPPLLLQVVVVRGVIQMLMVSVILRSRCLHLRVTNDLKTAFVLISTIILTVLHIIFTMVSSSRLPLGNSTTILLSAPILAKTLPFISTKESCSVSRLSSTLCLVSGVTLVVLRQTTTHDTTGYSCALLACLMSTLASCLQDWIPRKVKGAHIQFYIGLATTICGATNLPSHGFSSLLLPAREWVLVFIISVLGLLQEYCLHWADKSLKSPTRVAAIRTRAILLAFAVQAIGFRETPNISDLLGACLILAAASLVSAEKQMTKSGASDVMDSLPAYYARPVHGKGS